MLVRLLYLFIPSLSRLYSPFLSEEQDDIRIKEQQEKYYRESYEDRMKGCATGFWTIVIILFVGGLLVWIIKLIAPILDGQTGTV